MACAVIEWKHDTDAFRCSRQRLDSDRSGLGSGHEARCRKAAAHLRDRRRALAQISAVAGGSLGRGRVSGVSSPRCRRAANVEQSACCGHTSGPAPIRGRHDGRGLEQGAVEDRARFFMAARRASSGQVTACCGSSRRARASSLWTRSSPWRSGCRVSEGAASRRVGEASGAWMISARARRRLAPWLNTMP